MSSPMQSLGVRSVGARRGARLYGTASFALVLACAACSDPHFEKLDKNDSGASELGANGKEDAATGADARAVPSDASSLVADGSTPSGDVRDAASSPLREPEAGTPAEADRDAGAMMQSDAAPPASAVPDWAEQLVDQFALESFAFDASDTVNGVATSVEYALASISKVGADGAEYQLTTTLCQSGWSNAGAVVTAAYPEKLPPRRHRLKFQAGSFVTEPIDGAIGFRSDPIPECERKEGELITAPMARSWTTSTTCRCPGPLLPPVDDCRVTDPDDDKAPGYTVIGQVIPWGMAEVYGVSETRSQYINGKPRMNGAGFLAQLEVKDSSLQYYCKPSACANLSGVSSSCEPATSRVTFVPLSKRETPAGGWDCKAVLARLGEIFDPPPAKPSSCR